MMIRPIRVVITLTLVSALGAAIASFLVPWVVRFSMVTTSVECVLLAFVLWLAHRTQPVHVQRNASRLAGRLLRAGSVLVGLSAFKLGMEFYGDDLITGISEWLVILAILHLSIAAWDARSLKYRSKRWKSRRVSGTVHAILAIALTALHLVLIFQ